MKMEDKLLTETVELGLNMLRQSDQKVDHDAKCKLMCEIGYLQGSYRVKMGATTNTTQKSSYSAILSQLSTIQMGVMA
jgi:hypothetical protein